MRLNEHYVTLTKETDKKEKYYDEVVDCLEKSYAPIGGIQSNALKNLMDPDMMWKMVTRNGKVVAVTISKLTGGTRKVVLAGTDLSDQGKKDLRAIVKEDVEQLERKSWTEVSGAMENIYIKKNGAKPIPDDVAAELMSLMGKKVEPTGDGYHYTRKIGPNKEAHEKILVGDVNQIKELIKTMRANKIVECKEESRQVQLARKLLESKGYIVSKKLTEAYKIRYSYEGDTLSDYEGSIIVKADSEDEALEKAKTKLPDAWNFRIEGEISDLESYKKDYPKSNIKIIESSVADE